MKNTNTFKNVYVAMLVAIGLVLHIIESNIPIPVSLPGAKLGLANIASLLTVVIYGPVTALIVSAVRALLGGFLAGGISSIPYSLNGALFSTIIMWLAFKRLFPKLSLIGVSVLGAAAHNIAQIFTASVILSNFGLFTYLPVLLVIGTVTGYFIGLVANLTIKTLKINIAKQQKDGGKLL
ncbi:Gx transporter family protein [Petroclostridium xylanilyticum]|uniref:Gx transporter family protein n=1 Tax=Petroclostridium xylanilyticum TaxID=1792311 RepID=UPI001FA86BD9|nr:Gx transporter family protein [Petroclostridium xylanilyticum]